MNSVKENKTSHDSEIIHPKSHDESFSSLQPTKLETKDQVATRRWCLPDHIQCFFRKSCLIVFEHLIHILIMAPWHDYVLQTTVWFVDTKLRAENNNNNKELKSTLNHHIVGLNMVVNWLYRAYINYPTLLVNKNLYEKAYTCCLSIICERNSKSLFWTLHAFSMGTICHTFNVQTIFKLHAFML